MFGLLLSEAEFFLLAIVVVLHAQLLAASGGFHWLLHVRDWCIMCAILDLRYMVRI